MADAPQEPAATPLTLRLSLPAAPSFRGVATALAGKFAGAAGLSDGDAERVAQAVAAAAGTVIERAGGGETATLHLALELTGGRGVEITVRCGDGQPEIVRVPPE
jgi:hypothetical protein